MLFSPKKPEQGDGAIRLTRKFDTIEVTTYHPN